MYVRYVCAETYDVAGREQKTNNNTDAGACRPLVDSHTTHFLPWPKAATTTATTTGAVLLPELLTPHVGSDSSCQAAQILPRTLLYQCQKRGKRSLHTIQQFSVSLFLSLSGIICCLGAFSRLDSRNFVRETPEKTRVSITVQVHSPSQSALFFFENFYVFPFSSRSRALHPIKLNLFSVI